MKGRRDEGGRKRQSTAVRKKTTTNGGADTSQWRGWIAMGWGTARSEMDGEGKVGYAN